MQDEFKDKYIRLYADFENYRKRITRDFENIVNNANEKLILDILPTLDDLERASEYDSGTTLIYNSLQKILNNYNVTEIICNIGDEFDENFHTAVSHHKSDKNKTSKNKIYKVLQRGYLLNNKVIRHTKVIVTNE